MDVEMIALMNLVPIYNWLFVGEETSNMIYILLFYQFDVSKYFVS